MKITVTREDKKVTFEIADDLNSTDFLRECIYIMKALEYHEKSVDKSILELAKEIPK